MSEFLETAGKVLGVIGSLGTVALTGIKLYREAFKKPPETERDRSSDDSRSAPDRGGSGPSSSRFWFGGIAAALAVLLLGLAMLAVGSRMGKVQPREVIEKPDAEKVQQARNLLQFRDGVPISARDLHKGMHDLMYSGLIQKEYGGKVILVTGTVSGVSDSLHTVDLEAGAFPATVACEFGVRDHDRIAALRKGQTVIVRAEIQTYRNGSGGEVLRLVNCELASAEGGEKADPKRPR